tara:strand:- start:922 stop:2094 length:1173 start_codon:yes stop_codon:yes gene_type:complete
MKKKIQKFIPYGRHNITESDIQEVLEVLLHKNLTQGDLTQKFEEEICKTVSANYSVVVNSATSALHLSCLALGLKAQDNIWTSPNSFVASANCGAYIGANVDFVDIDPNTGLLSISKLEKKLKNALIKNKLPKIIIPVHLAGSVCNMEKLFSLSKKYKFSIIEDASHAIGSKYKGGSIGNCKYSDLTVFSFHPVKIITSGEGGCITTNNLRLFNIVNKLRSHGITKNEDEFEMPSPGAWAYEQQLLGYNYRMSDIHAALGLNQLKRLDEIVFERNRQFCFYKELLDNLPLRILKIPKEVNSSIHLAIIRLENKDPSYHKNLFNKLRTSGIGVQIHYTPIHLHPYYRKFGFSEGDFPEAEFYSKNAMSLPLFIGLSENDQIEIANSLKNYL